MENEIFIVFELSFRHKDTGVAYVDCTCNNIHDAHILIRQNARRGYVLEKTGIGAYKSVGFCENERIAYQTI